MISRLKRIFDSGFDLTRPSVAKDRDDLCRIVQDAANRNLFEQDNLQMLEAVLNIPDLRARDIMLPRQEMVVVHRDESPQDFMPRIIETAHSRIPVVSDDPGEVVGVLLVKDLLGFCVQGRLNDLILRDVWRPPVLVPESQRVDVLLRDFRTSRNHMAMVMDEYGSVTGMVTIEDVLEQIVGDIVDEYDMDEERLIFPRDDHVFIVKGKTPLDDFNEALGTHFASNEYDTIAGLLINRFAHIPSRSETLNLGQLRFEVLKSDARRIHLIRVTRLPHSS